MGAGRPRNKEDNLKGIVGCYMSLKNIKTLDEFCKKVERSKSFVIEKAVMNYIENYSEEENKLK